MVLIPIWDDIVAGSRGGFCVFEKESEGESEVLSTIPLNLEPLPSVEQYN